MLQMWKRIYNPWEPREAPTIGTCNVWTEVPNINPTTCRNVFATHCKLKKHLGCEHYLAPFMLSCITCVKCEKHLKTVCDLTGSNY